MNRLNEIKFNSFLVYIHIQLLCLYRISFNECINSFYQPRNVSVPNLDDSLKQFMFNVDTAVWGFILSIF